MTKLTDFDLYDLKLLEKIVSEEIDFESDACADIKRESLHRWRVQLLMAINELKNEEQINSN